MDRKLTPEGLTRESFLTFGEFQSLFQVDKECYHAGWGFYPDILQLDSGGAPVSCSMNVVSGKSTHITRVEYHNHTGEGILPLDKDICIFVGPAHWENKLDEIKLFRVPAGTLVKLKKGVLHGAPMSADGSEANVLILLPERTYANDCVLIDLEETDWIPMEL